MDIVLTRVSPAEAAKVVRINRLGMVRVYKGNYASSPVRAFLFDEPTETIIFEEVANAYILSLLMAGVDSYRDISGLPVRAIYISSTNLFNNCYDENIQQTKR